MKKTGIWSYVYDFSIDYDSIDVDDILDIHKIWWKTWYKILFRFVKKLFIELLRFGGSLVSGSVKCVSINNEPCLVRSTLIDLNSNDCHYYPFMASLRKCNGSCNTLDDFSSKICILNKTEDIQW